MKILKIFPPLIISRRNENLYSRYPILKRIILTTPRKLKIVFAGISRNKKDQGFSNNLRDYQIEIVGRNPGELLHQASSCLPPLPRGR